MPNVDSPIHVQMFDTWKKRQEKEGKTDAYGMQWGDPDINPELSKIKAQFVSPFIDRSHTALEIGPGGGRWTRYLLGFAKVYAVDLHEKLLEEHARNIRSDKVTQIRNNGSDFPCIPDGSVHYLCSFATFVHFDIELIADYLHNMRRVLAPGANVVIQYADKDKPKARDNPGFADTTPAQVRALLASL